MRARRSPAPPPTATSAQVQARHEELVARGTAQLRAWFARALPVAQLLMFTRLLEHCDRMLQLTVVSALAAQFGV
jgi:hypothetical protein